MRNWNTVTAVVTCNWRTWRSIIIGDGSIAVRVARQGFFWFYKNLPIQHQCQGKYRSSYYRICNFPKFQGMDSPTWWLCLAVGVEKSLSHLVHYTHYFSHSCDKIHGRGILGKIYLGLLASGLQPIPVGKALSSGAGLCGRNMWV